MSNRPGDRAATTEAQTQPIHRAVKALALTIPLVAAACVTPNGTVITPAPGGGVIVSPPAGSRADGQRINPQGFWCFEGRRGGQRQHSIKAILGGMIVGPTRRPQVRREYEWVGGGRYEEIDGPGIYIFYNRNEAVFSRDGSRSGAVDAVRCN